MDFLGPLAGGFAEALTPVNLLAAFLGVLFGTLVGVLPGLGPTAAIALLIGFTAGLPPVTAIIVLAGLYYGAMYGSSTTAILLNVPGEAASVITTLDGYKMARRGRAGPALAIAAIASFVAGSLGVLALAAIATPMARVALSFGPPEYFGLLVLGLSAVISLSGRSVLKGLASAAIGLLIGMVGLDPQTGAPRFVFGSSDLLAGIGFLPVVVGLYGLAEILINAETRLTNVFPATVGRLMPSWRELKDSAWPTLRSSVVGFLIGVLPGGSPTVAAFLSYDLEKHISKNGSRFGEGVVEGVAAPEAANNSATSGGFVPLLTLGLPTTPTLAVLLGALLLHGLAPGPLLFSSEVSGSFVWTVIASMYIGNVMLLILNLPLVGIWVRLLRVPYPILAVIIVAIAMIGAFSLRNNMFDVWIALVFGFIGYGMRKLSYPPVPLVLALILSGMTEQSLRQTLSLSTSGIAVFLERPIALTLLAIAVGSVALSVYARIKRRGTAERLINAASEVD